LFRKACSHESYCASLPGNIQKAVWFVPLPPPLGVWGLRLDRFLDIGETGFYLSKVKSKYIRGHRTFQIRILSHYTIIDPKVNIIMTIEPGSPYLDAHVDGSQQNPRRWVKITTQHVDQYSFGDFIESILYEFESHPAPGNVDNQRIILGIIYPSTKLRS